MSILTILRRGKGKGKRHKVREREIEGERLCVA